MTAEALTPSHAAPPPCGAGAGGAALGAVSDRPPASAAASASASASPPSAASAPASASLAAASAPAVRVVADGAVALAQKSECPGGVTEIDGGPAAWRLLALCFLANSTQQASATLLIALYSVTERHGSVESLRRATALSPALFGLYTGFVMLLPRAAANATAGLLASTRPSSLAPSSSPPRRPPRTTVEEGKGAEQHHLGGHGGDGDAAAAVPRRCSAAAAALAAAVVGVRRRTLVVAGVATVALGMGVMGVAPGARRAAGDEDDDDRGGSIATLALAQLIIGLGGGFVEPTSYVMISEAFDARALAAANGALTASVYVGLGVGMLAVLAALNGLGWRGACFVYAAAALCVALALAALLPEVG